MFVKDESISMQTEDARKFLPKGFKHSFLIRHPVLQISSLRKAAYLQLQESGMLPKGIDDLSKFDVRKHKATFDRNLLYESQHALWKYIRENVDRDVVVIDSSELLSDPAKILSKYCKAMGLTYSEDMLHFDPLEEAGKRWKWPSDDLISNKNYLGTLMSTSTLLPPKEPMLREELTEDVKDLSDRAMPLYLEMVQSAAEISHEQLYKVI